MITLDFNKKPIPKHPTMTTKKATKADLETNEPQHWNDVFFAPTDRLEVHINGLESKVGREPLLDLVAYMAQRVTSEGRYGGYWTGRLAYALAFLNYAKEYQLKGRRDDAIESVSDAIGSLTSVNCYWPKEAVAEFTHRAYGFLK